MTPVIIDASSEHRKHAALPISSGVENLPIGIVDKNFSLFSGVSPPIKLFNKQDRSNPCLLSPGDSIKFKSISKEEFEKLTNE